MTVNTDDPPSQDDLDLVNQELEKDGEEALTLEELSDLREQLPDFESDLEQEDS